MYHQRSIITRWYTSITNTKNKKIAVPPLVAAQLVLLINLWTTPFNLPMQPLVAAAAAAAGDMAGTMANQGSSNQNQSMGSNMMMMPAAKPPELNITTAGPPITPAVFKSMASEIHVNLVNATVIAEKWVGNNSQALSSIVAVQNGHLIYTIWVVDGSMGLHQIVVDPISGKVLLANQPMSMTGPFS